MDEAYLYVLGMLLGTLIMLRNAHGTWLIVVMRGLHKGRVDISLVDWGNVMTFYLAGLALVFINVFFWLENMSFIFNLGCAIGIVFGLMWILNGLGTYYLQGDGRA